MKIRYAQLQNPDIVNNLTKEELTEFTSVLEYQLLLSLYSKGYLTDEQFQDITKKVQGNSDG